MTFLMQTRPVELARSPHLTLLDYAVLFIRGTTRYTPVIMLSVDDATRAVAGIDGM